MKKNWVRVLFTGLCLVSGILAFSKAYAEEQIFEGTVLKVYDGDTILFKPNDDHVLFQLSRAAPGLSIRMVGIDTPETHLPVGRGKAVNQGYWGEAASDLLKQRLPVPGTQVRVVSQSLDKYGRVLGRVYLGEEDINLFMIRSGWAAPYIICDGPQCNKTFFKRERVAEYLRACDEAKEAGRGIYDPQRPLKEMPFEFRMRARNEKPQKYVGDISTRKLYAPFEYKKVDVCRRIFFLKRDDANRVGFH